MDALGPYGLGIVFDIIDAVVLGNPGIHVVVTDRAKALREELEAQCPAGWRIEPLFAPERDRLSEAAYAEPGERGAVLLDVLEPREQRERAALIALNTDREWLSGPRKCAVVVIAGKDTTAADSGLLELQAKAPDFWAVRTRLHRAVGSDEERTARDALLDRLAPRLRGDRAAAARWLDGRSLGDDWVAHRLWREGPGREAWLALAVASTSERNDLDVGSFEVREGVAPDAEKGPKWSSAPIGEAIAIERWSRPIWPSGKLAPEEQALVEALGAALDQDGTTELYLLPEDTSTDALNRAVLTLGLLREARYDRVLHLDAAHDLEVGIARCLAAAGDEHVGSGLIAVSRRLQGALGKLRALILITEASSTDLAFVRATLPGRELVATIRTSPHATFCVCGSERAREHVAWAAGQLSGWPLGAIRRRLGRGTLPLDLRAALAQARHLVLLLDSSWESSSSDAWATVDHASARVAVFGLGSNVPSGVTSVGYWYGDLGTDEGVARDRVGRMARALAGEPVADVPPRSSPWPQEPVGAERSPVAPNETSRDALLATQRAVEIDRALARDQPETFLPGLAADLINLSLRLSAVGRHEDALTVSQQALSLYRALAEERPGAFEPSLAHCLGARGSVLQALQRNVEAGRVFQEALDHIWPHFERMPQAFARLTAELLKRARAVVGDDAATIAPRIAHFEEITHGGGSEPSRERSP